MSHLSESDLGEYIDCTNPLCYNGGFGIGPVVREMVGGRETCREGAAICQGNEGSPKGWRIYRKCINHFRYTVELTYRRAVGRA